MTAFLVLTFLTRITERGDRYEIQEKMQNFMVPIPVINGWHDEQIDELFSSLLGKGFQENDIDTPGQSEEQPTRPPVDLAGFRVFG